MKYVKPEIELTVCEEQDIIRTSELGNDGLGNDFEEPFQ